MALSLADRKKRLTGIGGSDIGAIAGVNPYRKPIDVWQEKTTTLDVERDPASAFRMRVGHELEPLAASEYQMRHGGRGVCHLDGPFSTESVSARPWHLFTVDRVVLKLECKDDEQEFSKVPDPELIVKLLEIKTAGRWGARAFGEAGTDDLPFHVIAQCAWYMSALNVNECDVVAILNGNEYREYQIQRDRKLEAHLLEKGEEFWKMVQTKTPPDPDGSASFSRFLKSRFAKTTELITTERSDVNKWAEQLRTRRFERRMLERDIDLLEQRIQFAIGEDDGIDTAEGCIKYKLDRRGRVRMGKVASELARRLQLSQQQFNEIQNEHRGDPPRRFYVPADWSKDE